MMKRIGLILAALTLSMGVAFAQDMAQATETAKIANESLISGDNETALTGFQQALQMALACGEEGAELAGTCKNAIPQVIISIAKDFIKAENYGAAISKLEEAVKTATEFGVADKIEAAKELIPQVFTQQGNSLLKSKDFVGAITAFSSAFEKDPENGAIALRLGQAYAGAGKIDVAVETFKKAASLGQEENANKQLGNIFLKKAATALKAKDFAGAVAAATEATTYTENPQAFLVAGQASQQLKKNADAVGFFEKYLELAPTAKNANAINFTVAALYQQLGNKAKAIEFFTKVAGDPQFGAQAKQQLDALKK